MNRKQFFDKMAAQWDSFFPASFLERLEKEIIPLLGIKKADKILDVGSGTGIILPLLKKAAGKTGEVTAMDFSGRMLKKAEEKYGAAFKYVRANAKKTPFKSKSFDIVICFSVFPHFVDKLNTLKELKRILKPGGRLVIAHADSRETINNHHRKVGTIVAKDLIPDDKKMQSLLNKAGYTPQETKNTPTHYLIRGRRINN